MCHQILQDLLLLERVAEEVVFLQTPLMILVKQQVLADLVLGVLGQKEVLQRQAEHPTLVVAAVEEDMTGHPAYMRLLALAAPASSSSDTQFQLNSFNRSINTWHIT